MYSIREWVPNSVGLKAGAGVTHFFIKNKFYIVKYTKSFPELLQRAFFSHLSYSDLPPNDLQM